MSQTNPLREFARDPDTRMAARRIADAVLDLVAGALRLIPVPVLRAVAAEAFSEWVRPIVLREIDRLLGGDGDPTDEADRGPSAREVIERVGTIPVPVEAEPPARPAVATGPALRTAGPLLRSAGPLLRRTTAAR